MDNRKAQHGGYIRKVSEETRRYTQELLGENERLRAWAASLEVDRQRLREDLAAALARCRHSDEVRERLEAADRESQRLARQLSEARRALDAQERETARLRQELAFVDRSNQHFSEQFATLEQQNNNLANLYVASYRLHGTVDRREVLDTLQEIIVNLVGSEELAVFEMDEAGRALSLVAWFGIDPGPYRTLAPGLGRIGRSVATGEKFLRGEADEAAAPGEEHLTACIPLKLQGRVRGAIAIFRLLPQKEGFAGLDHEIFDLLASHSATALYCSALHARFAGGASE